MKEKTKKKNKGKDVPKESRLIRKMRTIARDDKTTDRKERINLTEGRYLVRTSAVEVVTSGRDGTDFFKVDVAIQQAETANKRLKKGVEIPLFFHVNGNRFQTLDLMRFAAACIGCSVKDDADIADFLSQMESDKIRKVDLGVTVTPAIHKDTGEPLRSKKGLPIFNNFYSTASDFLGEESDEDDEFDEDDEDDEDDAEDDED